MEFICKNKKCKHTFHPHSYIAVRHPNLAKCPECGERACRSEKGKEDWKELCLYKNQREKDI